MARAKKTKKMGNVDKKGTPYLDPTVVRSITRAHYLNCPASWGRNPCNCYMGAG